MRPDPRDSDRAELASTGIEAENDAESLAAATQTEVDEPKQPSWKAWTYQRRLERFNTVIPEEAPPPLPRGHITATLFSLLDIKAGRRSWRTLESELSAQAMGWAKVPAPAMGRLRRVRVFSPDPWSVEVAAVLDRPGRCAALALRWDYRDDHWELSAVEG